MGYLDLFKSGFTWLLGIIGILGSYLFILKKDNKISNLENDNIIKTAELNAEKENRIVEKQINEEKIKSKDFEVKVVENERIQDNKKIEVNETFDAKLKGLKDEEDIIINF
jgi:hypothetical protein